MKNRLRLRCLAALAGASALLALGVPLPATAQLRRFPPKTQVGKFALLSFPQAMLGRPVNEGFSGGERKRNELLQLALLQPRLAVLDEIDSGMDVDGVRAVVQLVQNLRAQGTAFVVVSHYLQLIESLEPDTVLRLDQGCIAESGDLELARRIARTGYAHAAQALGA